MQVPKSWKNLLATVRAAAPKIIEFAAVQGVVQFFNALSGFIIVRTLSKNDYAQFAVVNSMQSTCNLLADLGIGMGMRTMTGKIWNDRVLLGSLLRQATALRFRFATITFAICLPILSWMLWRSGASPLRNAYLTTIVLIATFPLLILSPIGTVLQFHLQLRKIQNVDLGIASTRLASVYAFSRFSLTPLTATLIPAVTNWIQLYVQRPMALKYVELHGPLVPEHRQELLSLSLRALPNMMYQCFQGQITFLILSYFGNTTSMADITALTRISAPLTLFAVVFANAVAPRFSRNQNVGLYKKHYFSLIGATALLFGPLPILGHYFPKPFIWLIGPKYADQTHEIGLVLLIAVVTQIAGALWCLNYSKGWVNLYLRSFIPVTLIGQVLILKLVHINSTRGALLFTLATSLISVPIYLADALVGIRKAQSEVPPPPVPSAA